MKKNLIALVVLLNSFLISVDAQKTPFLTQPFSNVNISEVFARTQGGNIDVEGGNQSDSRVEMFITANGNNIVSISKEEIQQRLNEYYSLDISATGRKLTVTAKVKDHAKQ